ncbi:MAG: DUF2075 domain-containing protein [Stomatobaculum sp.]|nr:DUF2075 domain-containing protein [Stomatobaculum sp.]
MRAVNLYFLSGISNERLFSDYENILSGRNGVTRIRRADQTALRSLLKALKKSGLEDLSLYEGFFFSFVIDHIGKEFDLLKVRSDRSAVLNIELKSQEIEPDRIEKQLLQNRYYLNTISSTICSFTYVSSDRQFYTLDQEDKLVKCKAGDLIDVMKTFSSFEPEDLSSYFHASDFIISPVSAPERFLNHQYFLTNQQLFYRKELLGAIGAKKEEALFLGITGEPGTGKTLLLYDMAKTLGETHKVLLIHGAALSPGHLVLKDAIPSVTLLSIRDVTAELLEENSFDIIMADESQRLYQVGFDLIVSHTLQHSISCIFVYDPSQVLSLPEKERDISSQIELLCGKSVCSLSSKLRTNPEAAAFVNNLFNLKCRTGKYRYENITLLRASSPEEEQRLLEYVTKKGYVFCGMGNIRDLIGQEFDKVVVTLDSGFFYDSAGLLSSVPVKDSSWLPDRVLFQNVSRCREDLCLIVTQNDRIFKKICGILLPPGK